MGSGGSHLLTSTVIHGGLLLASGWGPKCCGKTAKACLALRLLRSAALPHRLQCCCQSWSALSVVSVLLWLMVKGLGAWVVLSLILLVRGKDTARSGWILQVAIGSVAGVSNSFGFMTMGPSLRTEGGLK